MTGLPLQLNGLHTESGIPGIGKLPWGSHFCHFYRNKRELTESLVPYFEAGLNNHERCLWITAEPLPAAEARAVLEQRIPVLPSLIEAGKIIIRDFRDWYVSSIGEDISEAWVRQEQAALRDGCSGLRVAGNAGFLTRDQWDDFADYERKVNKLFEGRRIIAFCSYDLRRCQATDIFEVVRNHRFTIDRLHGKWEVVESDLHGPR